MKHGTVNRQENGCEHAAVFSGSDRSLYDSEHHGGFHRKGLLNPGSIRPTGIHQTAQKGPNREVLQRPEGRDGRSRAKSSDITTSF
jgi:hypothetical protein